MQIKAKYFVSITQYHRALADNAAAKYGDALVRLQLAEAAAKEAHRAASNFNSVFLPQMSLNLPADSGQSLFELVKSQLALSTERRTEAQRDNDLIYNAVLPTAETLPSVDKTVVATAIPIQEIYGTPEVQKVIGPDLFMRLIPLSVHESASIYSEEKAKLVRSEVEKAEGAAGEARSALDTLGVKAGLPRFRAMVEGSVAGEDEIPLDVRRYRDDISVIEEREGVEILLKRLGESKETVRVELESIGRDLDAESQECEAMRVKYGHQFTQAPSSGLTKEFRTDLKSRLQMLDAAKASDEQVQTLWDSAKGDVRLLISDDVENVFKESARGHDHRESLLDLDTEKDDTEKTKIAHLVEEIDERLGRLNKIERERDQTLKDLKEKVTICLHPQERSPYRPSRYKPTTYLIFYFLVAAIRTSNRRSSPRNWRNSVRTSSAWVRRCIINMPPFRKSHNYGGRLEISEDAGEHASGMKENDERRKLFGGSCRRVRSIWKSKMVSRQYPSASDYLSSNAAFSPTAKGFSSTPS